MSGLDENEISNITERYARRSLLVPKDRYSYLNPSVYMAKQESERAMIRGFSRLSVHVPLNELRLLEVGCGSGANLLTFLRIGIAPHNLVGNELLPERLDAARRAMPPAVEILQGDAARLEFSHSFDVVVQSTVFSSILSAELRQALAANMWRHLRPGGAILWYDFTYDNPRNPDVKGIRRSEVKQLFPEGQMRCERITLAPPISRLVTRVHPSLYTMFNLLPLLRTHILCWIEKTK